VTPTIYAPNNSYPSLTFENFDSRHKRIKAIETCILFIDIRKSIEAISRHNPETLAKLYSSFIRSMIKAAENFNGKIRNIVAERIMVVFDSSNCFTQAVNTAILVNTISRKIINNRFQENAFTCGIGIDYGKMLAAKCGAIKHGIESSSYHSLVWFGRPANVASKLTDAANKPSTYRTVEGANVALRKRPADPWVWQFKTMQELVDNIEFSYDTPRMRYKDKHFSAFFASFETVSNHDSTPPILISESVYTGFKKENPKTPSIKQKLWKIQSRKIPDYDGTVYGSDLTFGWQDAPIRD
jgi:class 3 adenylate cyclase